MKTIHKFVFDIEDEWHFELKDGAQVLKVERQGNANCLWALLDLTKPTRILDVLICGTGFSVPDNIGPHIATWQAGPFVWHMFVAPDQSGLLQVSSEVR